MRSKHLAGGIFCASGKVCKPFTRRPIFHYSFKRGHAPIKEKHCKRIPVEKEVVIKLWGERWLSQHITQRLLVNLVNHWREEERGFHFLHYHFILPLLVLTLFNCHQYFLMVYLTRVPLLFPQNFVLGLSILLRGSLEDKLRWTFSLYDQDKDGFISRYVW